MRIKAITGETILIDKKDYKTVSQYGWKINNLTRSVYTNIGSKNLTKTLHYLLTNYPNDPLASTGKAQVKHKNGNKLDNRRSNLEIIYTKGANQVSYTYGNGNCEVCNSIFQKKSTNHKICSDKCRKKKYAQFRAKVREIKCLECNIRVISSVHNRKWCSDECRITFNKKNKKKQEPKSLSAEDLTTNFFPATKPRKGMLIIDRDGLQCAICGKSSYRDCVRLHVDHIMPWSKGGRDYSYNLITLCERCNLEKSDFLLEKENIENLQAEARRRNRKYGISDNLKVPNSRNYKKW